MPTIGTIEVEELAGSPTENRNGPIITARMVIKCAWADRWTVVAWALNDNYGIGMLYPHDEALLVYCKQADVQPFTGGKISEDGSTEYAEYEVAQITLSFRNLAELDPVVIGAGAAATATSERLEGTMFGVPLSYKHYKWGATGDPIKAAEAPALQIHGWSYTFTHHHIALSDVGTSYTIHEAADLLRGYVNDASVSARVLPDVTFPAGTLLCKPLVLARRGDYCDFTYRFEVRMSKWNWFWRGDTNTWDQLYLISDDSLIEPYPEADFSTLSS